MGECAAAIAVGELQTFRAMSTDAQPETGRKSGRLLSIFVLAVLVIAAVGCKSPGSSSNTATNSKVRTVLHLDTFVLNLAGPDERAYLRAGIDLGLRSEAKSKQSEAPPVALVRDTILGVLGAAKPDDILTLQGKQALKANLLRALQERVPELEVEEVYFTEFLIQR